MADATASEIATAVKSAAVTINGRTSAGIPLKDQPTAVATALAMEAKGLVAQYGYWNVIQGQPQAGDVRSQAVLLGAFLADPKWSWDHVPTYHDGSFSLYMPQAVAALAAAGPALPPQELTPAPQPESALQMLGDVIHNVQDPLFWRQVWFVLIGWTLIGVGVFQLLNRGLISPAREGIRSADEAALEVANLRDNVVRPFKAYRQRAKAARSANPRSSVGSSPFFASPLKHGGTTHAERTGRRPLANPSGERVKPPPAKRTS